MSLPTIVIGWPHSTAVTFWNACLLQPTMEKAVKIVCSFHYTHPDEQLRYSRYSTDWRCVRASTKEAEGGRKEAWWVWVEQSNTPANLYFCFRRHQSRTVFANRWSTTCRLCQADVQGKVPDKEEGNAVVWPVCLNETQMSRPQHMQ